MFLPMSHGMRFSDKQRPSSDEEHKRMSKVPHASTIVPSCMP